VDKVLHCDCGFEARAADEEELVTEVQRHAREAHGMALSHDEALLLTFQAELGRHGTVADGRRSHPGSLEQHDVQQLRRRK
jgi:hypothetical protein